MYGRISEWGDLSVERGPDYIFQKCPYNVHKYCGDTCPLFFEENGRVYPCGNKNVIIDIMLDDRYTKGELTNE